MRARRPLETDRIQSRPDTPTRRRRTWLSCFRVRSFRPILALFLVLVGVAIRTRIELDDVDIAISTQHASSKAILQAAEQLKYLQSNETTPISTLDLQQQQQQDIIKEQGLSPLSDFTRPLHPLAQTQLSNYLNGTGIILNLHIVHHAGTAFCNAIGRAGPAPPFACWKHDKNPQAAVSAEWQNVPWSNPWRFQDTAKKIARVRQHFHMISWEYGYPPPKMGIRFTNWDDPNLFSVLIIRHPMDRLLAGDRIVAYQYPGLQQGEGTKEQWERYAQSVWTDNFALRVLAGVKCCQGADTALEHLETAQAFVDRFSVVLDMTCLTDSLKALADLLQLPLTERKLSQAKKRKTPRERIGHDDVYEELLRRNKRDIELYEYAKKRSLLDCDRWNAEKERRAANATS